MKSHVSLAPTNLEGKQNAVDGREGRIHSSLRRAPKGSTAAPLWRALARGERPDRLVTEPRVP